MSEVPVVRLFSFRPTGSAAVFDSILRDEILPDVLGLAGVVAGYIGRRGPDQTGERLMVSVWESRAAMSETLGDSPVILRLHPEHASAITDIRLDVLPVEVALRFPRPDPPRVLRVFRGEVRESLDAYVDAVRQGTLADGGGEHGPNALYLGIDPPARFVTVSAWSQWSAIEASTGASVREVSATRHRDRLSTGTVAHYEILVPSRPDARTARAIR